MIFLNTMQIKSFYLNLDQQFFFCLILRMQKHAIESLTTNDCNNLSKGTE